MCGVCVPPTQMSNAQQQLDPRVSSCFSELVLIKQELVRARVSLGRSNEIRFVNYATVFVLGCIFGVALVVARSGGRAHGFPELVELDALS